MDDYFEFGEAICPLPRLVERVKIYLLQLDVSVSLGVFAHRKRISGEVPWNPPMATRTSTTGCSCWWSRACCQTRWACWRPGFGPGNLEFHCWMVSRQSDSQKLPFCHSHGVFSLPWGRKGQVINPVASSFGVQFSDCRAYPTILSCTGSTFLSNGQYCGWSIAPVVWFVLV